MQETNLLILEKQKKKELKGFMKRSTWNLAKKNSFPSDENLLNGILVLSIKRMDSENEL